ncbi:MAG: tetratricopeptide repeat protein [Gemmataceae bacterium]
MAKKPKYKQPNWHVSEADIRARVEKALRENRHQQALELAKQLYKSSATDAHRQLMKKAILGCSRQLRTSGYPREAASLLNSYIDLDQGNPDWLRQVAEELAACGESQGALELLARVGGDPQAQARLLARSVDAALQRKAEGRSLLPESLHGQFDLILQAFQQLETEQDDALKETLQGIGLQSPFLEWKVMLRGLQAYYQQDDARTLENWQRLDPERLPAQLIAPLRFDIDTPFRVAQSPQTQLSLSKKLESLQGSGLIDPLRRIQAAISNDNLGQAFRLVEGILPAVRREHPRLTPRLASFFYWSIVHHGQPEDIQRYRRLFGSPEDDLEFHRMEALAMEDMMRMPEAHAAWQRYEKWVADHPKVFPGDQARQVRALIWSHMGHNAAHVPDTKKLPLPPFLRDHPDRPKPLKPTTEECFRRSLQLDPKQLTAHEELFHYYQREQKSDQAEQAGRALLEHFPDHLPTLRALANFCSQAGKYEDALHFAEHALKVHPLDQDLRDRVGYVHMLMACRHAEADRFEDARAEYQAALRYYKLGETASVFCKWAACEFKAGHAEKAEELIQQALAKADDRLAITFSMLIEVIRLKLTKLKKRFNDDFNAALNQAPTAAAAVALASTVASHRAAGITYHGQKTHEKKALTYLEQAAKRKDLFKEEQLESICESLLSLGNHKLLLHTYTALGQRKFPNNPLFPFFEADGYIRQGPDRCRPWQVMPLLEKARNLTEKLPRDDKQQKLLQDITDRQAMMKVISPFMDGSGFFNLLGSMLEDGDFFNEDEDDYF